VDDFQYALGQFADNFGLAVAPSGILYAGGFGYDAAGYGHGLVMSSADGGITWSAPIDDFLYPGLSYTRYDGGLIADSSGNLYVAGRAYGSGPGSRRFVRRSTDGGATWSIVDDVAVSNYAFPEAGSTLAADAAGNIYVTVPTVGTWTVRKGVGGTSFSTVDTFPAWSLGNANSVFVHPSAGIFAAGSASGVWVVRRSLDGGATWSTVDTYGSGATAYAIGTDAQGNIYVTGKTVERIKGTTTSHWIVRRSGNGGGSWSTVDDFVLSASGNCIATGFACDSLGNLFVVGDANMNLTPSHWIVRENPGGTGGWRTVDDFPGGGGARVQAIVADAMGTVFVGGWASPSGGGNHWIVRKN
jgi:hypothetical protein